MTWHRISVARDEGEQISELLGAALGRNRRWAARAVGAVRNC